MSAQRTPEEIRRSIEANRAELGLAVENLRGEIVPLFDTSLVPSAVLASTSDWSPSHHTRSLNERQVGPQRGDQEDRQHPGDGKAQDEEGALDHGNGRWE